MVLAVAIHSEACVGSSDHGVELLDMENLCPVAVCRIVILILPRRERVLVSGVAALSDL
jgi:hypothetical protein